MKWEAQQPLILTSPVALRAGLPHAADALKKLESIGKNEIWAGYFSYELGHLFENLPEQTRNDLNCPLIAFSPLSSRVDMMSPDRSHTPPTIPADAQILLKSTFTRDAYLAAVRRCIEYIAAGDVFQINLSQRFTAALRKPPVEIFNHLQHHFPSRYPAFFDFQDHQIISNSPELFLKVDRLPDGNRRITNRPIKGTRPRLPGMEAELEQSPKDQAELAMIVDLQRNDLGRICKTGTVKVVEPRVIETHPTIYHGVATIEGILKDSISLTDILRATFPCGSITGCPKIRAMEIIDELEPVQRGPYCGAIGWICGDGTMEFSVAIRTMIVQNQQVYMAVGGGIVADSTPEDEYRETLVKARAMFMAAGIDPDQLRIEQS